VEGPGRIEPSNKQESYTWAGIMVEIKRTTGRKKRKKKKRPGALVHHLQEKNYSEVDLGNARIGEKEAGDERDRELKKG